MTAPQIAVVGSLNVDLRFRIEKLPRSGETIAASGLLRSIGGKGGNQAVAAARLGRQVAMVGAVGSDDAGQNITKRLQAEGIDVSDVDTVPGPTGTAVVLWEQPESTIIVEPGANAELDARRVRSHESVIGQARSVLCQLETPAEVLDATLRAARGLTVLNPAPVTDAVPPAAHHFDLVIPNRYELAAMAGAGKAPKTTEDVVTLARTLSLGGSLVVTLGADGCVVIPAGADDAVHLTAMAVDDVVDTTAAGDSFCAALVDAVLDGSGLVDAARWASRVAAVTTTRHGAMDALPHRSDISRTPPSTPKETAASR